MRRRKSHSSFPYCTWSFLADGCEGQIGGEPRIDGIVLRDGTSFLATDFWGMLLFEEDETTTVLMDLNTDAETLSAADPGYDPVRNQVAIPDLFASNVVFINLGAR